jgi:hypothetical protein
MREESASRNLLSMIFGELALGSVTVPAAN